MAPRFGFATLLCLAGLACSSSGCTSLISTATSFDSSSLAQTYTGVLQETGGTLKDYVSLDQTVTVSQSDEVEFTFSSSAFPSFTGIVVSTGDSAVALNIVGYTPGAGVQVQEVAFTKDSSGEWILVIQTASGLDAGADGRLVQFVSYDPKDAPPSSATAAVQYLDDAFALAFGSNAR